MSRSAAARITVPEEPLQKPELVPMPLVEVEAPAEEAYTRVGEELREDDRRVVESWVRSLRAKAGEIEATREAWEALATVGAALVFGVVLCYFLAHL